jgi:hypothetical protein
MSEDKKFKTSLRIRIDDELLEQLKLETEKLNTDISTYVRWCIRTGLYLDYLNVFLRSEIGEEEGFDELAKRYYKKK